MLFTRFALLALPFIGSALATPVAKSDVVQFEKRDDVLDVVKTLQSTIADPISTLKTDNVSADDAQAALSSILDAINTASAAVPTSTTTEKRALEGLTEIVKRDDLNDVGTFLAQVITDIVNAVEGLADDLQSLPLIGALITSIDGGLHILLLGVEVVLEGVIQILQGLLSGLGSLLSSLGAGLVAGLILV
ncbi:hypothetical protein L202_01132 [Cryptococcus amylolentus CBS 6039]|uniref:Sc15 protein n=1 Tax=Cryptococcus amylolentus CBS 6039 TaxID=1295533 RepID=A0A1E3I2P2_9TREE|nr:hypothetical protein L202_01132 [Cryptococcus amylolentus CBS 6039]ODN82874.1 hypothetical protein L202_01132 [Cryptococcus amylolentus CBS 6039]